MRITIRWNWLGVGSLVADGQWEKGCGRLVVSERRTTRHWWPILDTDGQREKGYCRLVISVLKFSRCEQDLNLRRETLLDFESNALTTRPSQLLLSNPFWVGSHQTHWQMGHCRLVVTWKGDHFTLVIIWRRSLLHWWPVRDGVLWVSGRWPVLHSMVIIWNRSTVEIRDPVDKWSSGKRTNIDRWSLKEGPLYTMVNEWRDPIE